MRITIILLLAIFWAPCMAQSYTDLCQMGEKCFKEKEYKKAAEYFTRAGNAAKNNKEKLYTLLNTGYSWKMAGSNHKAAEYYAKAIAIDSTNLGIYLQRGNTLLEIDSTKAAIECYNKIADKMPDNSDILFFRAYAYTKEGMFKEAKKDYIELIAKNPNDNKARLGLALLYQKEGSINESLMMFETLIEEEPDNSEYYVARCNIESEQGQYELALLDIEKAIELNPQSTEYHRIRAEILEQAGKEDAARKSRAKAQKIMKNSK